MTPKMFLFKAGTKAANSATAFLQQYRSFLETGELCEVTSPILRMLDDNDILPTPALELIREAVTVHHIRTEAAKAERRLMETLDNEGQGKAVKNWIAIVYNQKGEVQTRVNANGKEEELDKSFELASDADRWADRRLFEGASDWYAVISHSRMMRADGDPISNVIMRQDAIARILKIKKGPMSKKTGTRDGKLSFGVKAHQDHAHFSRG